MVNQDLITELRKEFSMTHDDFYMVLTDTDMRVKVGPFCVHTTQLIMTGHEKHNL